VSISDPRRWRLDPDRVREALAAWEAADPDPASRRDVSEFLMDLVVDPLRAGREDGETGIWVGWANPFVTVMYVPDRATRQVFVADISYRTP
jgi:hypothetical protein